MPDANRSRDQLRGTLMRNSGVVLAAMSTVLILWITNTQGPQAVTPLNYLYVMAGLAVAVWGWRILRQSQDQRRP